MDDRKHKIVFINGPRGSGKDTAADLIVREFSARKYGMKWPMRDAIIGLLNIEDIRDYNAFFENQEGKLKPSGVTLGLSPVEMLIWMSEDCLKPKFGPAVLGKLAVRRLSGAVGVDITAISDSGFEAECVPVVERFGAENCFLMRLHRPGHDFTGDSRSYIDLSAHGVQSVDVRNNWGKDVFEMQIGALVRKALVTK